MRSALLARLDQIENWVWQALSRAGSGDTLAKNLQYTFVFRPGATPPLAPNVYTTWAALMADVAKVKGPVLVEVDSSIAPAHVTVGTWNFPDGVTFQGHDFFSQLFFDTGAHLVSNFIFTNSIVLNNVGTTIPYVTTATSVLSLYDSVISATAAAPFMHVAVTTVDAGLVVDGFSEIGDGTNPAITIDAGQELNAVLLGGSNIATHALTGAGIAGIGVSPDSGVGPQPGLGTLDTFTLGDDSFSTTNGAPVGPASPVAVAAASPITRQRGGHIQVAGSIGVTSVGVGGGTITFNLLRDAVVILTRTVSPDAGGHAGADLTTIDTLTDFAPHTYSIQAVASAGTMTIATGNASISGNEV